MKIGSDDLKALYREHVEAQSPPSRRGCLAPEEMVLLLRGGGRRKERKRFVEHISSCGECAREFGFLLEAARAESALIADLEHGESAPAVERRPWFLRLSWGLAPLVVGVFAVGFLLWRTVVGPSRDVYRATPSSRVELVSPRLPETPLSALAFQWKPVTGAESYTIEVFDEALKPLWKSEPVSQTSAGAPATIKAKLEPRKTYFWMVTAHFPERDSRASSLQEFSLK